MTRGQIFTAVNEAVQNNEEHKKYFTELGKCYSYLKARLPEEMKAVLDEFYFNTIGVETVIMETAFKLGRQA